jgi:hypothetical protein
VEIDRRDAAVRHKRSGSSEVGLASEEKESQK